MRSRSTSSGRPSPVEVVPCVSHVKEEPLHAHPEAGLFVHLTHHAGDLGFSRLDSAARQDPVTAVTLVREMLDEEESMILYDRSREPRMANHSTFSNRVTLPVPSLSHSTR